jgi:hypothetical protein
MADLLGADPPIVEVDTTAARDIARTLDANDVVVSTVGPFMQLGIPAITAAAQAGAHYLDSTGEGGFVRYAAEHLDTIATSLGATIVPAFGYDYVPGNLAGALALTQAGDRARRVEVGYFLTRSGRGDEVRYRSTLRDVLTLTTGGTRTTIVAGVAEDGSGGLMEVRGAPKPVNSSAASRDAALARRLSERSAELTGVDVLAASV